MRQLGANNMATARGAVEAEQERFRQAQKQQFCYNVAVMFATAPLGGAGGATLGTGFGAAARQTALAAARESAGALAAEARAAGSAARSAVEFDSLAQSLRDLGGKPLTQERLKLLRDQLSEHKIILEPVTISDPNAALKLASSDRAKFRIRVDKATGQPQDVTTIYFRPGATGYDLQHELFHASHARTIGYECYIKLTPREVEQFVFDQMIRSKTWEQLTAAERQHAIDYLYYKHPGSDLRGHTPSATNPFE